MHYRISTSLDENVTGKVEIQSVHSVMPPNYTFDERHIAFHDFRHIHPDENLVIPQPILEARAKLTDLVSSAASGFDLLMSNKLKAIIDSTNHVGSQIIPVTLYNHAVPEQFWLLHGVEPDMSELDYERSEFQVITNTSRYLRDISIPDHTSFENVLSSIAEDERIRVHRVAIRPDCELDLLLIRYVFGGAGFFVSEKLKRKIQDSGCTGIRFIPGDKDFFD